VLIERRRSNDAVLARTSAPVKDAAGACERSDVLDRAVERVARLGRAQNNSVVLGRLRQASSSLPEHNWNFRLDKKYHI